MDITWWVEGPYLRARSLCLQRSYLAGRRSGSYPQGSRIKIPWQCRSPGRVSHVCRACSIKSCFPVPYTYLPSLILSCDHFPLRECLLIVWVLPSFLPLHSHKPGAHPCTALLLLWGNAPALCILSGKKNYSCLPKIWNQQLIIPHLLCFKNEHGQGQGIISRLF